MIVPLVIAVWIVVLLLVAGLCGAARKGDLAQSARATDTSAWERGESRLWEPSEPFEISARATARPSDSESPALHRGGVAA
jgi:hypothetical protein